MNENAKRVILSRAVAALLAASLVPSASAAQLADAVMPPAVVQEAEVQQTEQTLEPAAEEKELQQVQEVRQEAAALAAEGSLQAWIDAADAGQVTTLTLQGETSEDLTIPAGKIIVLDLNGHTLTNKTGHTITNYGTLTITGSGTVDNVSHARAAVYNQVGGEVTLDGGTYTRSQENGKSKEDSGNNSYYNIVNWGEMTINAGVTVSQSGNFSSMIENGFYNGNGKTNNPKLTINGGTFSGGLNTVKNDDRGVLEIVDGTFTNVSQAAVLNWNETTIKGGTFTANDKADAVILNGHIDDVADQGKLTITGGTFTGIGNTNIIQQMDASGADAIGTVTISGGTFTTDNGEIFNLKAGTEDKAKIQLSGGKFATSNEASKGKLNDYVTADSHFDSTTGTVSVKEENAAASVGGQNYRTLQAAIDAASNGVTVVLKQGVVETVRVPAGKELTLDLAGKNIQNGADNKNAVIVSGKLTIQDSTATTQPQVNGSNVTYVSGKITGVNTALAAVNGGEIIVESGSFECTENMGVYAQGNFTPGGAAQNSKITVKGGYILAQECAASAQGNGATLDIQGGVLKAKDNAVISGNGTKSSTKDCGSTIINISGGTMIGTIQSSGYIACGVYHPQEGTLNITGGRFQIEKGVGVLVRAGSANITGGEIITTGTADGKVGDSQIIEGCYGVVYDTVSKYPGAKESDVIAIGGNVKIVTDTGNDAVRMRRKDGSTENHIEVNGGSFSSPVATEYLKGLNVELQADSGNAPYSYYADEAEANKAAEQLGGGTVKTLRAARIGDKDYATLADAIAAAKAGETVTLLTNVHITGCIEIRTAMTIDFAEYTLSSDGSGLDIYADLTLKNGTLNANTWGIWIQDGAEVNIAKDMTINADLDTDRTNAAAVTVVGGANGKSSVLNMEGTVTARNNFAVSGNGSVGMGNVIINIKNGAKISSTDTAVYMPNTWQLNISGGEITGTTGVYIKSGVTNITGGTITATGDENPYEYKNGGAVSTGQAVVIDKCAYPGGAPQVTITGGDFIAQKAANAIGSYTGGDDADKEPVSKFVEGGNYSSSLKDTPFLSDTLRAELKKSNGTAPFSYYPTYDAAKAEADRTGGTVTDLYAVQADMFTITDPNLTENGSDQIEAIRNAISLKPEYARLVGDYTVIVKRAGTEVTSATDAGVYEIYITCEAGTKYDAQATPLKIGSVRIKSLPSNGGTASIGKPAIRDTGIVEFADVRPGSYYYDAVRWAVENGITSGTSDDLFSPDAACTRAQVITFLWRATGSPQPVSRTNPFTDVPSNAYYRDAVLWAVEQGITNGVSATRFDPDATITRGQMAALLYRTAGTPAVSGGSSFVDVGASAYYSKAVAWAYQNDIASGTGANRFSPNAVCTRAQIVTFLYRAQ